jgi:hypothetical protein
MSSAKRGRSLAEVMSPIDDVAPDETDMSASSAEPIAAASGPSSGVGAARQSVVPINILVAPDDRRRLRQLSLDTNLSLQKLGHEAWNLLLQKRGLPPLKAVSANVPSGRSASTRSG